MSPTSTLKKIVTGRTGIALLVLAAFLIGLLARGGNGGGATDGAHPDHAEQAGPTTWTCSMHPQIQLPAPGQCPICFMDLIPLEDENEDELGPRSLVLSETAAALAEIRTAPVRRQAVPPSRPPWAWPPIRK